MVSRNVIKTTSSNIIKSENNIKKPPFKIEQFAELLLKSGVKGLSRWHIVGKLKAGNAGSFANSLRKHGINVTPGSTYVLMDIESANRTVRFINAYREKPNVPPLTDDVTSHWLMAFLEEVA